MAGDLGRHVLGGGHVGREHGAVGFADAHVVGLDRLVVGRIGEAEDAELAYGGVGLEMDGGAEGALAGGIGVVAEEGRAVLDDERLVGVVDRAGCGLWRGAGRGAPLLRWRD